MAQGCSNASLVPPSQKAFMFGTTKIKVTLTTVFGTVLWESEKKTVREAVLEKYKRR
jgi:hypothetical protein